jgi:signal peptidase II
MTDIDKKKYIKLGIISGTIIILDQLAKAIVLIGIPQYHMVPIIPAFFNLTHLQNPGGAFGFMAGQSDVIRLLLFIFMSSLAVGLVFYFYKITPKTHSTLATGFALIFSGAIGNMIDRFRIGAVVDFLDFYIKGYHWPAFNIADSAITIGMTIFVYHIIFKKMPE